MRRRLAIFVMLGSLFLGFLSPYADVSAERKGHYTAHVKSVVDGDTIHLEEDIHGSHKVRLLGIDTPETRFFGHTQDPWGSEATNFLLNHLHPGDEITVITDKVVLDRYGRLLAHIKKDKMDLNEELLKEGHATLYYIYPNMKYYRVYQRAVRKAMREKKGIWNPLNSLPEEPFEFRNRVRSGSKGTKKYVGDFCSKKYVSPSDYEQIPTQNRVFFWSKKDAQEAGYTPYEEDLEVAS